MKTLYSILLIVGIMIWSSNFIDWINEGDYFLAALSSFITATLTTTLINIHKIKWEQ